MAQQADGTIYIDTLLDTAGFKAGSKEVEASVRRMTQTVSGIGAAAKIALQKQTDSFVKANQAYAQQEQKVESLKNKLKELRDQKIPTDAYKALEKELGTLNAELDKVKARQQEWIDMGFPESDAIAKTKKEYDEIALKIDAVRAKQQEMVNAGNAYTPVDTSGAEQQVIAAEQRLQQMNNSLGTSFESLRAKVQSYGGTAENLTGIKQRLIQAFTSLVSVAKKTATTVGKSLLTGLKKTGKAMQSLVSGAKQAASALLHLHKNAGKSDKSIGTSLKSLMRYGLGIRSVFALVNKLRRALVDGFQNLAQYDNQTNASISSLKASLTQLKNSFATAFAPILNVVAPILKTFINMISRAVTYVGMLIAALTGQDSFVRAKEVQEDYAGSLGDTAKGYKDASKAQKGYLSGLDEVHRWESADSGSQDSGSAGAGGGAGSGDMFERVPIDSSLKNLAARLKEMWAKADFSELGAAIGGKLKDALDSIPWEKIKPAAEKVGKSIATFLNGGLEVPGLPDSIGRTIGELVNTGISGASGFINNFHFKSLGNFIATSMNSAISTISWSKMGATIRNGLNGIFQAAETWSGKFDFKALGTAVKNLINSALTNIKWKSAITSAKNIGKGIADALNGFITKDTFSKIGKTLGNVVNTIVSGAHKFIGTVNWKEWGEAIAQGINDFFETTDWEDLGLTFFEAADGILKALVRAVKTVDWNEVGHDVADMLRHIPWSALLKGAADLVGSVFAGLLDFGAALLEGLDSNEWTEFNRNIDKTLRSLENTNDEIETRIQNAADWKEAGDEYEYAEDLADKYFDLAEKESQSNTEKQTMRDLAGELVKTVPQLEQYYNSETGLLDTTRASVDNLIESLKTKARTEAAQDALKELYTAQMEAKKAMDEAKASSDDLTDHYETQKAKYDELTEKIAKATKQYGAESGEVQGLVGQQASYYTEMLKTEKKLDDVNEQLETAQTNYQDASSEIDSITGYYKDMTTEADKAAESTRKVGTKTTNTTGEFVKSIVQLGLMALGLGGVKTSSKDAEGGLSTLGTTITNFVRDLATNAQTALDKGKETGKNYPSGMAKGIEDNSYLVSDAGEGAVDDLNKTVENKADMHSPSKVAHKYGQNYIQGLANGIADYTNSAVKSLSNAITKLNSTMKDKGKTLIQSFVSGMKGVHIPTPHITFTTTTSQSGNTVKTSSSSSVSWYRKGGLFSAPSLIGVGEAGKEAVLPLENKKAMQTIAGSLIKGISQKTMQTVPLMASGTVIPPQSRSSVSEKRQDQVSALNDVVRRLNLQKGGTAGMQNMTIRIPIILDGRQLFEAVIDEAKMKQMVSGKNPFEMAY